MKLTRDAVKVGQTVRRISTGLYELIEDVAAENPKFPARTDDDNERRAAVLRMREMCPRMSIVYAIIRGRDDSGRKMDFYVSDGNEITFLSGYMYRLGLGATTSHGNVASDGMLFAPDENGSVPSPDSVTRALGELLYGDQTALRSRIL